MMTGEYGIHSGCMLGHKIIEFWWYHGHQGENREIRRDWWSFELS